jgi:TrpR-related protein YerC/YecD
MPQVSKYPISNNITERIFDIFTKTFTNLKGSEGAADFINDLFTPTEKVMLAKRIAIALLLLKGYDYRNISSILKVSTATIATVNISLRHGKGSYKKILDKITKEESFEKFFIDLSEMLLSVPAKSSKGGGVYRYLKEEIKKSKPKKSLF